MASAIEAEVAACLERLQREKTAEGVNRMVRNGRLPSRTLQTGNGDIEVSAPRLRDRENPVRFRSSILPPYRRRTQTVEELLPWWYLQGIATGDVQEALTVWRGQAAPGLSASPIRRLKAAGKDEPPRGSRRDVSHRRSVDRWSDGIPCGVRLEDAALCLRVVVGAPPAGKKAGVALADGYREREASWRELLLGLKSRGMTLDPQVAVGDGALGFWNALPQVFGTTRAQRCGVHKTANLLKQCPTRPPPKAKAARHEIGMRNSILARVGMRVKSAERRWRKLNGMPRLAQVIAGILFNDGVPEDVEKIAA